MPGFPKSSHILYNYYTKPLLEDDCIQLSHRLHGKNFALVSGSDLELELHTNAVVFFRGATAHKTIE